MSERLQGLTWRRRAAAAMALTGAVALGGAIASGPEAAAAPGGYTATASAAGFQAVVTADGFPVASTPFDGGFPVAQAQLASLGGGSGFASVVYPGDLVVSIPGLLAGLTNNGLPPIPDYPLIAKADGLNRDASVEAPGASMEAHATSNSVSVDAAAGVDAAGAAALAPFRAAADARVDDDGTVEIGSVAAASGFTLGAVRFGDIRSTASVTLKPDGTLHRRSDFSVSVIDVAGVKIGIGSKGLLLAGTDVPLDPNGTVGEVLAASGVRLRTLAEEETDTGVVAAGLELKLDVPTGLPISRMQLTVVFGRATASISGSSAPTGPPVEEVIGGVGRSGVDAPDTAIGGGSASVGSPTVPNRPRAPQAPTVVVPTRPISSEWDLSRVYLALAGAALLTGGAIQLVSQLGVRSRWT